jgi:hypothetical protein
MRVPRPAAKEIAAAQRRATDIPAKPVTFPAVMALAAADWCLFPLPNQETAEPLHAPNGGSWNSSATAAPARQPGYKNQQNS